MQDEKPSTKHLVLKPKEVIPIDRLSRPGDGTAISVQLIHQENVLAEARARRRKPNEPFQPGAPRPEPALSPVFKLKEIVPMDLPAHPEDEEVIAVPDILLENRVAEDQKGWGRVTHLKRRVSRRNWDFIIGIGVTDLAIVAFTYWSRNAVSFVYGIAAVTLVTSTSAWIMFVVMDDY
jgi:hypothetical protein